MKPPAPDARVSPADLKAILSFIPRLETLDAEGIWSKEPKISVRDRKILIQSGAYQPIIGEFVEALYAHRFIRRYDWGKWQAQAVRFYNNPELIGRARMRTCVKLLTLHIRKDKFVDGHLGGMLLKGHITAILRRMAELAGHLQVGAFDPDLM
ncbi:MAG TPA: DUF6508 domain-containing protein [Terracidiphilus sp.]|nr:DUF6508 domain-containing protein [Terracidiphilus sp.]